MNFLKRNRDRRARGDRGLAMVEMAIVAPLLALLVGGIVEYGTLWRDDLTITSSTRASTRVLSNLGDNHLSDYEALLSLDSGLSAIDGYELEFVLIYDASAADGEPPSACFSGDTPVGVNNLCNVYTGAEVAAMSSIDCSVSCDEFPSNGTCSHFLSYTVNFCPQENRETDQKTGLTSVGVWVRVNREYFTGLFPGDGVTIEDRSVMKVEPQ